jgi:hypothetical protein
MPNYNDAQHLLAQLPEDDDYDDAEVVDISDECYADEHDECSYPADCDCNCHDSEMVSVRIIGLEDE